MRLAVLLLVTSFALAGFFGCAVQPKRNFDAPALIAEVREAEARYEAAVSQGDYGVMAEFVTPDFVYIDISGNRMTPQSLLARRADDHRTVVANDAIDEEFIALSENVVIVRSHDVGLSHYYGGLPRRSESRSTVVWVKGEDGRWRMAAAQANVVMRPAFPVKMRVNLPLHRLQELAGEYRLEHEPGLTLVLRAGEDVLLAEIRGQFAEMAFFAEGEREFFAIERPFELRFTPDLARITLITWGVETPGARLGE